MKSIIAGRQRQSRLPHVDPHLAKRIRYLGAQRARIRGNWIPELGLCLASRSYRQYRATGAPEHRWRTWHFLQRTALWLAELENTSS